MLQGKKILAVLLTLFYICSSCELCEKERELNYNNEIKIYTSQIHIPNVAPIEQFVKQISYKTILSSEFIPSEVSSTIQYSFNSSIGPPGRDNVKTYILISSFLI
jgi:hypothetical protein